FSHEDMVWLRTHFNAPNLNESDISDVLASLSLVRRAR
ncbi:chorismate mutase, partial [Salmonella enterica]|nr:chorismate mutase [Salmonella enterica]